MWRFTATYRTNRYPKTPIPIAQFLFASQSPPIERAAQRVDISIYTFLLSDTEIARLRTKITDPTLSRLLTPSDKPAKVVSLYLRQFANQSPKELISVTAVPEILPEELKDTPDLATDSVSFAPHQGIPDFWRPGNPQLSDPCARGW